MGQPTQGVVAALLALGCGNEPFRLENQVYPARSTAGRVRPSAAG
jgi:hypothetical protein